MKKYYTIGKKILFPICRSLTGIGVKKTLAVIKKEFPKLKIKKIKSGTKVFDWKVPPEWNIRDAYVLDPLGKKIIDFKRNNLHLVGYSTSVNSTLTLKNLLNKIHFLKKQPKAIPYVTSYYKRRWGFCINYKYKKQIEKKYKLNDKFKILIDSKHYNNGNLTYGELILKEKVTRNINIYLYLSSIYGK